MGSISEFTKSTRMDVIDESVHTSDDLAMIKRYAIQQSRTDRDSKGRTAISAKNQYRRDIDANGVSDTA
jgi:hypothetical protein